MNAGFTQTVTVTVGSKQDAERAAKTLAKIMASNNVADGVVVAAHSVSLQSLLSNPIMDSINGSGSFTQRAVQDLLSFTHLDPVSASDRSFLMSHLTSYSTTVTLDSNGQVSLGTLGIQQDLLPEFGSGIPFEFNGSGKLDGALSFTRTITLASGTPGSPDYKPATVAYKISDQATGSGSVGVKLALNNKTFMGKDAKNTLTGKDTPINLQGSGFVLGSVTATYDLGDVRHPQQVGSPESTLKRQGKWDRPDHVQATFQYGYGNPGGTAFGLGGGGTYTPAPLDSGPVYIHTGTATVNDPAKVGNPGRVAAFLLAGALGDRSAVSLVEPETTATVTTTAMQGTVSVNPEKLALDPNLGVGDASLWATLNANITTTTYVPPPTGAEGGAGAEGGGLGPHGQYVVLPHCGLNVRQYPSIGAPMEGAILSGSFVQAAGKTSVDDGTTWIYVTGTDMNDRPVAGWVEAQYVVPHPQGALSGTGRIDPTKEPPAYTPVVVEPGETVWEIAAQDGVPVSTLENVNGQHIIDPSLIFPGDVVYVPTSEPPLRA